MHLAKLIVRFRTPIIIIVSLLTIAFGILSLKLSIDSDILNSLPDDDQYVQLFNYIGEAFNGNHVAVAVIEGDILSNNCLSALIALSDSIESLELGAVISLAGITDIRDNNGVIEIAPLIDRYNMPYSQSGMDSLTRRINSSENIKGIVISDDMKHTMLAIKIQPDVDKDRAAHEIEKACEHFFPGQCRYGGQPFLIKDMNRAILLDIRLLLPLLSAVMILILGVSFRSWRGVLLPLISVCFSIVWTTGFMVISKTPFTLISNLIPVIILAVGSAYSIHIINKYNDDSRQFSDSRECTEHALADVITPVILAAVTTMIGFISFIFGSFLTMIRDFGIFASVGVLVSLLISVTFMPAVLSFLPVRKLKGEMIFTPLIHMNRFIVRHPRLIIAFFLVILFTSGTGLLFIDRSVDIIDYFKSDSYTRQSENIIREKFGGSNYLQILAEGDMRDSSNLAVIDSITMMLNREEGIGNVSSISSIIKQMNSIVEGNKSIPSNRKIGNLFFLIEGDRSISNLINSNMDQALIQASVTKGMDIGVVNYIMDKYLPVLDSLSNQSMTLSMSGMPFLYKQIDRSIIRSQILSLLIASVLILIILCLLMKNIAAGFIGMIPIAFTLTVIFGFMGIFDFPLDIATALVGSITIGIGIDYTIHFIEGLKNNRKHGIDKQILMTLNSSGRAIFINMLTVAAGFLILAFAQLIPLRRFGILTAITMFSSAFAATSVLPALIILIPKFKKLFTGGDK